jgi:hypothetical protein
MVPSSALTITTDRERPLCDVFSIDKTINFRCLKFITDYFGALSPSPLGDGSDAIVMGSTHNWPLSPLRAMPGNPTKEFHTTSDREGRINLPSPRRHDIGVSTIPTTTIPCSETALTTQSMMTILPLHAMSQHEAPLGEETILMMDYTPV